MSDLCRGPLDPAPRRKIPPLQVEQNWLVGLAPPVSTAPFVQTAEYSYRLPLRRLRQDDVSQDWLLAVAPTVPAVPAVRSEIDASRRARILRAEDWPNLLTSTLAGSPPVAPPFVQSATDYYFAAPRRVRRSVDDSTDWMTIETATPVVPQEWSSIRGRILRTDDAPNLLMSVLSGAPFTSSTWHTTNPLRARSSEIAPNLLLSTLSTQAAIAPFLPAEYLQSPRRFARSGEADRSWLLFAAPSIPAVPPVAPDVPYTRAARPQRFDQWPNLQLTTFSIAPQSATFPPFELPPARRALTQRFDDHPNLLLTLFSIVATAPLLAPFDLPFPARFRGRRADEAGNLLLSTLSAQPFSGVEVSTLRRARALRADDAANLLLGTFSIVPQAVLPFASGEWPVPKIRRPYAIEASLNLTLTTLALVHPVKLRGERIAITQHDSRVKLSSGDRRITISFTDRLIKPGTT